MKTYALTKEDRYLIKEAKRLILYARVKKKQLLSEVGSALKTSDGKVYSGVSINIENSSQGSICGETGAIARLVADGGKIFDSIVAVWISKDGDKWGFLPPCGSCRNLMHYFGDPFVILNNSKKVKLKELYPEPMKK